MKIRQEFTSIRAVQLELLTELKLLRKHCFFSTDLNQPEKLEESLHLFNMNKVRKS